MRKIYSYLMALQSAGDSVYRQFWQLYNNGLLVSVQVGLKEYTTGIHTPSENIVKLIFFDNVGTMYFEKTTLEIVSNILMTINKHNKLGKTPYIYTTSD